MLKLGLCIQEKRREAVQRTPSLHQVIPMHLKLIGKPTQPVPGVTHITYVSGGVVAAVTLRSNRKLTEGCDLLPPNDDKSV